MFKTILLSLAILLVVVLSAVILGVQGESSDVERTETEGSTGGPDKPAANTPINILIDRARPGDTVRVPGNRVYRETVVIDKPVTLVAEDGAEIRGSDVWEGWRNTGDVWRSEKSYPTLDVRSRWICEEGTNERCRLPEQVYFEGRPLERVISDPGPGEFALDGGRHVLLGEDPSSSTVEVTVRNRWIEGRSDDVTIRGFRMRHSAELGIKNDLHDDWRVVGNDLAYAHTINVELSSGSGMLIEGNEIHHGGQLGISSYKAEVEIRDNRVHHNNTASFKTGWEAGGMKISAAKDALIEGNEVFENESMGIWTDVATTGSQEITIRGNRVYAHPRQGIRVEISKNVTAVGNVVYDNGMGYPTDDLNGAGITLSGTYDAEVSDNVLAYNNNGLVVVNVNREKGFTTVKDVALSSNDIIQRSGVATAWLKAHLGGDVYSPGSDNGGRNNRYYYPTQADGEDRYKWRRFYSDLSSYNDTPAEENGRLLSEEEKNALVEEHDLPE